MSSASVSNQSFTVVQRPKGVPADDVFKLEDAPTPKAAAGQIVAKALFTSVDPYLRNRLDVIQIPGPMVSGQVGEVVESQNDKFKVGDKVFYCQSHAQHQTDTALVAVALARALSHSPLLAVCLLVQMAHGLACKWLIPPTLSLS